MTDIFIVSGACTAIGTFGGSLASFRSRHASFSLVPLLPVSRHSITMTL